MHTIEWHSKMNLSTYISKYLRHCVLYILNDDGLIISSHHSDVRMFPPQPRAFLCKEELHEGGNNKELYTIALGLVNPHIGDMAILK